MPTKKDIKRYRLHYSIRKKGFFLETNSRTIYVPDDKPMHKHVRMLQNDFGYSIQLVFKLD